MKKKSEHCRSILTFIYRYVLINSIEQLMLLPDMHFEPFPAHRCFSQQMTFENTVTKGEFANYEQFLHLRQLFSTLFNNVCCICSIGEKNDHVV